ncbi:transmembrane sensor domain protein [Candidatus Magnetoovum chiemensis]|nr:transmembrane sensor domain protein [Candidatus Magnetoovum chiemensis]
MNLQSLSLNLWIQSTIVGLLSAFVALTLWAYGFIDVWEGKTWDWRASLMAKTSSATDDISIIVVDQASLDWMAQTNGLSWPWPREIYSVVVDFCKRGQAKAVAFDVLFTEPSSYGVEDDRVFGKAVENYGKVASAAFLKKLSGSHIKWIENIRFKPIRLEGVNSWADTPSGKACTFPKATMPIPELTSTSAMLCNVEQEPDADGIYRRARMISIFDNYILPALGLGVYFAGKNGINKSNHKSSESTKIAIEDKNAETINNKVLKIDNKTIHLDDKGEAILRYRGRSGTHKTYSAAAVIQSEIELRNKKNNSSLNENDLSGNNSNFSQKNISQDQIIKNKGLIDPIVFKDKYVFFSFSAPGLFDLRSSPVDSVYPGVEIQATILDNFLCGDFIREAPKYGVVIWVILWTTICAVCITFCKQSFLLFFSGTIALTLPATISLIFYHFGIWLPLVVQEVAAILAILLSLILNYSREGRQKRFIKNAFSQYLSPVFIEQLIKHPEKLKLGGERKELSIFFSDLQGFTSISEKLSPEELTSLLNNYLSAMTEIIHEEGGTVDKYEGDAIIAFWNAPLDIQNHASCAVRAALRCQKKLEKMNPEMKKIVGTDMLMRIGLNTGVVVVGNMGSYSRFDYTMLGDSVNLAARLEGANKEFGTYTMVSASTQKSVVNQVNEFTFREIAKLAVVGKKEAITVFEPMLYDEFKSNIDIYSVYNKGLNFFYNGEFRNALEQFSSIADRDAPSFSYSKKCNELIKTPPTQWGGVWTMTNK